MIKDTKIISVEDARILMEKAIDGKSCTVNEIHAVCSLAIAFESHINSLKADKQQLEADAGAMREERDRLRDEVEKLSNTKGLIRLIRKQQAALDKATQLIRNLQCALDYLQEESGVISRDIDSQYIQAAREFIVEIDKMGGGQG